VALLLIAATIVTPLALTAVWLRGEVLVTHRYVHTITPLASNPAIDSAVASQITDALDAKAQTVLPGQGNLLGKALDASLRSYTQETIERFLRTSAFRVLWIQANTQAHAALVAALEGKQSQFIRPDGSVDIDLSNALLAARTALGDAGIHAFDKLSPSELQRGIVIAKPESLHRARNGVKLLKALALGLPILALALYVLAFAISRERRRTLSRVGISLILAGAAGLAAIAVGRYVYSHHVVGPDLPQAAARALYNAVLSDLRLWFELTALGGVLATAAGVIAGPSRAAVAVRGATLRTAGGVTDEVVGANATSTWVAANKPVLRTVIVILGLLLVLDSHHITSRLIVEYAIGVLLVLGFVEILARPAMPRRGVR
jgi:multisubunit Na+/H+ antiporter MnhB subunit